MLSKFSVKKPVTIVMIVLIFVIFGAVSSSKLTMDLFPDMNIPYAAVSTTYVGASPAEVEGMVTGTIESALATVQNVKNIQSISSEHHSLVIVEFVEAANMDVAMMDMREKLDQMQSFLPESVTSPMIIKFNPNMMPIMGFSVTQEGSDMSQITDFAEKSLKPKLERIEGVASVSIMGGSKKQIEITLNSEKIKGFGLEQDMVANLIKASNLDMPLGSITDGDKDYTIRTTGTIDSISALEDFILMEIPVPMTGANGQNAASDTNGQNPSPQAVSMMAIKLKDIATVNEVEANKNTYTKVNGEDSISIMIQRQSEYNTTDVADKVNAAIDQIKEENEGMHIITTLDQSKYIKNMVSSVSLNAIIGALLAILILFIFLKDIRPTIIIGAAIPISIIVAFTFIWLSGISLNVISLGGLALGIGMLVDNAVVVLENIYRIRKEGKSRVEAAIIGSKQVAGAVTASTLTTIAVFLPVIFVQGMTAQLFKELAITVALTLVASLLVALTLVPMMSSRLIKRPDSSTHHKLMDSFNALYVRLLKGSLRHRIVVLVLTILVFVASIFGALTIGTELIPASDEGQIEITASNKGATFQATVDMVKEIEGILKEYKEIETVSASVGGGNGFGSMMGGGGAGSGTLNLVLVSKDKRDQTTKELTDDLRERIAKDVDGDIEVKSVSSNRMAFSTVPVQVDITGEDFSELERLALEVEEAVRSIDGTVEINNGIVKGAPEIRITTENAITGPLGVTVGQMAGTIRGRLQDEKVTTLEVDGQQLDVYINESANTSLTIDALEELTFPSMTGQEVVLSDIADIEKTSGYSTINRNNQKRVISVTAQLEEGKSSGKVGDILEEKLKDIQIPDGYSVDLSGENKEIQDSFKSLLLALLLGAVLVYMIMASQFESFLYPFVIMFSVPLAFTGAFIALFLTGTPLSIVAILGMIVLTGIVVNNGIVLVDYMNKLIQVGKSPKDAIIEAGSVRLRPILMTALTTILALAPLAFVPGEGAEMIAPLGVTVIGGLLMSTFLTLIVVPVIYSLFNGLKGRLKHNK